MNALSIGAIRDAYAEETGVIGQWVESGGGVYALAIPSPSGHVVIGNTEHCPTVTDLYRPMESVFIIAESVNGECVAIPEWTHDSADPTYTWSECMTVDAAIASIASAREHLQ